MLEVYLTEDESKIMSRLDKSGHYIVNISKNYEGWEFRVADLIDYESSLNHIVKLNIEAVILSHINSIYGSSKHNDSFLRKHEPEILVHSTSHANWLSIQRDMTLKSWNYAKSDGSINEETTIGEKLGDPSEYKDYVMFGGFGYYQEIVTLSKQLGELCYDIDRIYKPGVRIYLDAKKIAKDGLIIRDGLHFKVKNKLDIRKYILHSVMAEELGKDIIWTPRVFSKKADASFLTKDNHDI